MLSDKGPRDGVRVSGQYHDEMTRKHLEAQVRTYESQMNVDRERVRQAQQAMVVAEASPAGLASLIVTPISLAVGIRGYLEGDKARRELSEKKREIRQQRAEFSRKLAEQRKQQELNKQVKLQIPTLKVETLTSDVPLPSNLRRGLLGGAAAGLVAAGAKLGQTFSGGKPEELSKYRDQLSDAERRFAETSQALETARAQLDRFQDRLNADSEAEKSLREDLSRNAFTSAKEIERLQEKIDAIEREKDSLLTEKDRIVSEAQTASRQLQQQQQSQPSVPVNKGKDLVSDNAKTLLAGTTGLAAALGVLGFNTKREATLEKERLENKYEADMTAARDELETEREAAKQKMQEQESVAEKLRSDMQATERRAQQLQDNLSVQQNRAKGLEQTIDLLRESEKRNKDSITQLETARAEAEAKGKELRQEIQALNFALAEAQEAITTGNENAKKAAEEAANKEKDLERDIRDLRKEVVAMTETNSATMTELQGKKKELSDMVKDLNTIRADAESAEIASKKAIEAEKARVADLTQQGAKLQSELKKWQEDYATLKKLNEDTAKAHANSVAQYEQQIKALKAEIGEAQNTLTATVKALEDAQKDLQGTKTQLGSAQQSLSERDSELEAARKDIASARAGLQASEKELSEEKTAAAKLTEELDALRESLEASSKANTDLTSKYEKQVEELNSVILKNKQAMESIQKDLDETKQKRHELKKEKSALESELEGLRSKNHEEVKRVQGAYEDLSKDLELAKASEDRLKDANKRLQELEEALEREKGTTSEARAQAAKDLEQRISEVQEEHAKEMEVLRKTLASTPKPSGDAGKAPVKAADLKTGDQVPTTEEKPSSDGLTETRTTASSAQVSSDSPPATSDPKSDKPQLLQKPTLKRPPSRPNA